MTSSSVTMCRIGMVSLKSYQQRRNAVGEIIRQTMYVDKPYQSRVFDLVHTINDDGTEQRFDFNKVVPEPAEFPPVPEAQLKERCLTEPQSYWRFHNWGCCINAWDAKYRVNTTMDSPFAGLIGLFHYQERHAVV